MIYEIRRKKFSDVQVVKAYQTVDKVIQRLWYEKCRAQFDKGTSNYGGLTVYDLDDLFQDSFIILWRKMESFQLYTLGDTVHVITKEEDKVVPDILGYFMRIVKNKYLEMFHSGKYVLPLNETITSSSDDYYEVLYWDSDPEEEKLRIVSRCLLSLPKSCLEILTKFYYEKKSLEQILAERPENNSYDGLKSRKSKCMTNLKKRITESFAKVGLK